jgi:hypothetical protein
LLFNILMAYKFLIVPILTNRWYNYNIDFLSYYKKWSNLVICQDKKTNKNKRND